MTNEIGSHDLNILSKYHFNEDGKNKSNDQLMGLKWVVNGKEWQRELVLIDRRDATCWNIFLSYAFNIGKLRNTSISLNVIANHLSRYDWQSIKLNYSQSGQDANSKAFVTVCHLANRQMERHRFSLFVKVSYPIANEYNFYWNPAVNGRFLQSIQRYRLPDAVGLELRFKDTENIVTPYQKVLTDDLPNIEVGYEYEFVTEEIPCGENETRTIYHYHFSAPPYYQIETKKRDTSLLLQRSNSTKKISELQEPKNEDIKTLTEYEFIQDGFNKANSHVLGLETIQKKGKVHQKLINVSRKDATCWAILLSYFKMGKLKNITVSLDKVSAYLARYNWKEVQSNDSSKLMSTIYHVANREFALKRMNLSEMFSDKTNNPYRHYWNTEMNGRFLLAQQQHLLPKAWGIEISWKDSKEKIMPHQKITKEEMSFIQVGFQYQSTQSYSRYYYHYPRPPYYQVVSQGSHLPNRREISSD